MKKPTQQRIYIVMDFERLNIPKEEDFDSHFEEWEKTLPKIAHPPIGRGVERDLGIDIEDLLARI